MRVEVQAADVENGDVITLATILSSHDFRGIVVSKVFEGPDVTIGFHDGKTTKVRGSTLVQVERDRGDGGIYVASRASIPDRGKMWRLFRKEGWKIISTWIDEDGPGETPSMTDLWARIVAEVTTSKLIVLYVRPADLPIKGALVEVGMALAAGIRVAVVAPGFASTDEVRAKLGSWVNHPLVEFHDAVGIALHIAAVDGLIRLPPARFAT